MRNRNYHTSMGNHMPYGITQCHLPPGSGDFPAFTPAEAGTRSSDPGGMLVWVDLGGGYIPREFTRQRQSPISEITKQCHDWDSNQRREGCKSNVLTTTPPSHLMWFTSLCYRNWLILCVRSVFTDITSMCSTVHCAIYTSEYLRTMTSQWVIHRFNF